MTANGDDALGPRAAPGPAAPRSLHAAGAACKTWPPSNPRHAASAAAAISLLFAGAAHAQRAGDNAVATATDGFGVTVGNERSGLYSEVDIRGYNPLVAGNARIEGLYMDREAILNRMLVRRATMRVGLAAQGYPFAAPSGIVDYQLRTPGGQARKSVFAMVGSGGVHQIDVDVEGALANGLATEGAISLRRDEFTPGDSADYLNAAILGRAKLTDNISVRAFWSVTAYNDDHVAPLGLPASSRPPTFARRYFGQPWALAKGRIYTSGVVSEVELSAQTKLRFGLFNRIGDNQRDFADLYRNIGADGFARHFIVGRPPQRTDATSGELRLEDTWTNGDYRQQILGSLTGRRVSRILGGAQTVDLGSGWFGRADPLPQVAFSFRPTDRDQVDQGTLGIAYLLQKRERGEVSISLQKTWYRKRFAPSGGAARETRDDPYLLGATGAYDVTRDIVAYASYFTGLEENGSAPENAANYPQVLPALVTKQADLGVRWAVRPHLGVGLTTFYLQKPYFALDPANRYSQVGTVRNLGAELSAAGKLTSALSIVAGLAVFDPLTSSDIPAFDGRKSIGFPSSSVHLNVEYAIPHSALSVDAAVTRVGTRYIDSANRLEIPADTTVDLGARLRLPTWGSNAVLRVVVYNLFNDFGWKAFPSGALQPTDPRRVILSLAIDL